MEVPETDKSFYIALLLIGATIFFGVLIFVGWYQDKDITNISTTLMIPIIGLATMAATFYLKGKDKVV